jgi:lactate dehydrogenase-like 2-hydroxyacid dehydrogenase
MSTIFVTRHIPEIGINMLRAAGHTVDVSTKDGVLTKSELIAAVTAKPYDAVLCLLTDTIDAEIFDAVPTAKIFANYAVGYNNIDMKAATARGVTITNTPGVLTNSVAEFTLALMLSITKRVPESERFLRAGKYDGWGPELLLGSDLKGKTLGILGAGRIGSEVAKAAHFGFGMSIVYYDIAESVAMKDSVPCEFKPTVDEVLTIADIVTVHVPLLPSTEHLINAERLRMMKKSAYLINTSRGPVVDEAALVSALQSGTIRGAALDVFEHEPQLAPGLAELENVVITPHVASATEETRGEMAELAAQNIIDFIAGATPKNVVTVPA